MYSLTRTTVRLHPTLKKAVEAKAFELDITFQELFDTALREYLHKKTIQKTKKIIFKARSLGTPLDNLTREDLYAD